MPPRQRHGQVRHKPVDVSRELAIGGVAASELLGMAEVGAAAVAARAFAPPFLPQPFRRPHLGFGAASLALVNRGAGRLADGAARLPRRGSRFDALSAQLAGKLLPPLLDVRRTRS